MYIIYHNYFSLWNNSRYRVNENENSIEIFQDAAHDKEVTFPKHKKQRWEAVQA